MPPPGFEPEACGTNGQSSSQLAIRQHRKEKKNICPRRKRKICDVTILLSTPSYQHCLFLEAVKFSAVNCGSLTGFSSAATLDLASCP
ncbi:hypothetical protein CEXT_110491 [Caerostris extrusa]|uniref:Uncharacterized protein n=1 Tax=Caerostris extrusa TaxID=172846 RepID=A0AAV4SY87_CAEEX|nr:hypothetical protein CEXT_110491 [Caerostris extrusa]